MKKRAAADGERKAESPGVDEIDEVAAAWIRYAARGEKDDFWAWDRLASLIFDDPEQAWVLLRHIVAVAPLDQLGSVGAGPLEDFVRGHWNAFGSRIEEETRRDGRFREALAAAWLSERTLPAGLLERLQVLTGRRILVLSPDR